MLKTIGTYANGSEVEVDNETAELYVEKKYAEAVKSEEDVLTDGIHSYIDAQIKSVEAKLAKDFSAKAKVKQPAVAKENDWDFKEWIALVGKTALDEGKEKAYNTLVNKYDLGKKTLTAGGSDTSAGYLVPEIWSNEILSQSGYESLFNRCRRFEMPTDILKIPVRKQTGIPSGGTSAFNNNMTAAVVTEANEPSSSQDLQFDQITITAYEFVSFTDVTLQLLENSPNNVATLVQDALKQLHTDVLDYQLLNGTDLTALLGHASTITVGRDDANVFALGDAANMYSRLAPGSMGKACWLMHPYNVGALISMRASNGQLAWMPGNSVYGAIPNLQLLGLPVVPCQFLPSVGSQGDVVLADLSQYIVGVNKDITIEASKDARFHKSLVTYRARMRVGGRPALNGPIRLANGTDVVSPTVVLDSVAS